MLSLQIHPRQRAAGGCSRDVTTFLCLISTPNIGSLTVCCIRSASLLENQSLEPKSLLGAAKVTEEVRQRSFQRKGLNPHLPSSPWPCFPHNFSFVKGNVLIRVFICKERASIVTHLLWRKKQFERYGTFYANFSHPFSGTHTVPLEGKCFVLQRKHLLKPNRR